MPLHPHVQRLDAQQEQESRKGAHAPTCVAQPVRANVDDEGDIADRPEGLLENHAVVGIVGSTELRPACRVLSPREGTAIDDRPADVHPMAAQELRRRVDHDIHAVLDRAEQGRRQYGVIDDHRQASLVCYVREFAEIGHIVLRIADAFEVDRAGVPVSQLRDLLGLIRVEEADLDAEFLERLGKQRPGSTVEIGRGKEVSARCA